MARCGWPLRNHENMLKRRGGRADLSCGAAGNSERRPRRARPRGSGYANAEALLIPAETGGTATGASEDSEPCRRHMQTLRGWVDYDAHEKYKGWREAALIRMHHVSGVTECG